MKSLSLNFLRIFILFHAFFFIKTACLPTDPKNIGDVTGDTRHFFLWPKLHNVQIIIFFCHKIAINFLSITLNTFFYIFFLYHLIIFDHYGRCTVKPVKNGNSQKDNKLVFNFHLMQVKNFAECSKKNNTILFENNNL